MQTQAIPMKSRDKMTGAATPASDAQVAEARVNLAATYRLVELAGWGEGIFNHISLRVPGSPREFFIKRHELTYSEVTASNLIRISVDDDLDEGSGVNRPGFVLHSTLLKARPDLNCFLHVHTRELVAVGALERGLRMHSQSAARFFRRLGYHAYEGLTEGLDEGPRIAQAFGDGVGLMLRNHGGVTGSTSTWESMTLIKHLVEACKVQLLIESAGGASIEIPEAICLSTVEQLTRHNTGRAGADWPAALRRLDAVDPSYRY